MYSVCVATCACVSCVLCPSDLTIRVQRIAQLDAHVWYVYGMHGYLRISITKPHTFCVNPLIHKFCVIPSIHKVCI